LKLKLNQEPRKNILITLTKKLDGLTKEAKPQDEDLVRFIKKKRREKTLQDLQKKQMRFCGT
jgi:hypothetical protein